MKLYWKVGDKPVGRYRSFDKRSWPKAYYDKECDKVAAIIYCDDSYVPSAAKAGTHSPLTVHVADYSKGVGFDWRAVKGKAKTLDEAKSAVEGILRKYPHLLPKGD